MILGTDHHPVYDGIVNFNTAYANGSRYTFIKACDGLGTYVNYRPNILNARAAGVLAAPYVWLYESSYISVTRQAEYWYSILRGEPLVVIDFEGYGTHVPKAADLYGAIERWKQLGGGKIMIYTGHYYWTAYGNTNSYWLQFPVWLARYSTEQPQPTPPWPTWTVWQFSSTGDPLTYGVTNGKKAVDLNYFDGTPEQLAALFGAAVPPEPPPGDNMEYEVIVGSLSIRPTAGTTQAAIGYLLLNDHVTGTDTAGWVKLATWTRAGVPVALPAVNCYSATGNGAYLKVFTPPPATETATVTVTHEGKTGTAVIPLV
jgi:lysozyme